MMKQGGVGWFAAHELRLAWRDFYAMLSGNRPGRAPRIIFVILIVGALLHLLAWSVLAEPIGAGIGSDAATLAIISGLMGLPLFLMISQAMESITRAFYSRSDLELVLASPAPSERVFIVRMLAIAAGTLVLTTGVSSPAINVLAAGDSPRWLLAYPVILALGLGATALAILATLGMFLTLGPKRTRLAAQIAAAIIGAGFVIGVQLLAILSIGSMSRLDFLQSPAWISAMPAAGSLLYLPARAVSGDGGAALVVITACIVLFAATLVLASGQFGKVVVKAASIDMARSHGTRSRVSFRDLKPAAVLRRKEWKLLLRDKWLMSQTLMQLLYLVPPAVMLWQGFGNGKGVEFVVIPVIVMAAGQLAGGLAWLAISGEDAPEMVATAPVEPRQVIRAKVEAVLAGTAVAVLPLLAVSALLSPAAALIGLICFVASVCSATAIQLFFRSQAKRSNFRRRQTSSRVATIAEAFSSILWAGVAGIWIAGSTIAIMVAALAAGVILLAWWISPQRIGTPATAAA